MPKRNAQVSPQLPSLRILVVLLDHALVQPEPAEE